MFCIRGAASKPLKPLVRVAIRYHATFSRGRPSEGVGGPQNDELQVVRFLLCLSCETTSGHTHIMARVGGHNFAHPLPHRQT